MNKNKAKITKRKFIRKAYASISLFLLVGVFLLPQFVYASSINDENIIEITNKVRKTEGLETLSANQLLSKAAYDKADAIFKAQIFKHDINDKKFSSWIKDTGYDYSSVGENLAIDFSSSEGAMEAWLDSPSHKKNILNPKFEEIGVAVKEDSFEGHKSLLVVQIFGTPANSPKSSVPQELKNITGNSSTNGSHEDSMLTDSAPNTLLVTSTKSGIKIYENRDYLSKNNSFYGIDNMQSVEQVAIYIVDYASHLLIEYYWTIIALLLTIFSISFVWHRKHLHVLE